MQAFTPGNEQPNTLEVNMLKIKCPKCGGDACLQSIGKTAGTAIGILVGIVSTVITYLPAAKVAGGANLNVVFSKLLRSITSGTIELLANVSTGGFIGQQAGSLVDENLVKNYSCLKCQNKFRI